MIVPGVPAPGFVSRMGDTLDRRRGVEFQDLRTKSLINRLTGTGMPFGYTVNPFRGCEFGCRYCYARPTHEYLGHADPADFEHRIYVKRGETAQLISDLKRARESGREVAIGAATDPYQPAEGRFRVTRSVLEAIARVPGLRVGITTKSGAITRDIALLTRIARTSDLHVNVSLVSLDAGLLRIVEPRAPHPERRLGAIRALTAAGVPARLFIMPVLPLLTDSDAALRALLLAARDAGAAEAISQPLFLRTPAVWAFFLGFVEREFPWALPRYRDFYPRPGSAPREYREDVERRVDRIARQAGFAARSREARVQDEAPARSLQLSLEW